MAALSFSPIYAQSLGLGLLTAAVFLYADAPVFMGVALVCVWHQCCLAGHENIRIFVRMPFFYFGGAFVSLILGISDIRHTEVACVALGSTVFLGATISLYMQKTRVVPNPTDTTEVDNIKKEESPVTRTGLYKRKPDIQAFL